MTIHLEDKFVGCFLALTIGDILGAPVEGMSRDKIKKDYGEITDFLETNRGYGKYTDDTQMSLALAYSIIDCGKVYASDCSYRYLEFFDTTRGYGAGTIKALKALKQGTNYQDASKNIYPNGSYGSGGAMRVAPVGLTYRNESDSYLRYAVTDALICTHTHPEAVDGATIQAKAVAIMTNMDSSAQFDPQKYLDTLLAIAETSAMKEKLTQIKELIKKGKDDDTAALFLGNRFSTSEAVACAIFAVAKYYENPENAIIKAVGLGGNSDTIASMAGAQMGALHGQDWIPARWLDKIENDDKGKDYIINLAKKLTDVSV